MGFLDMLFGKPKQTAPVSVNAPSNAITQEEEYLLLCKKFGKKPYKDIAYFVYVPSNQNFDNVAIFHDDHIYWVDGLSGNYVNLGVYDIVRWQTHYANEAGIAFMVLSMETQDGTVYEVGLTRNEGDKLLACLQAMWAMPYVELDEDDLEGFMDQAEKRENTFCAASGIDPQKLYPLEKRINGGQ